MKKTLLFILILFLFQVSFAQQLPQISMRQNNLFLYNPAVAGSTVSKEIKLLHRSQWVGFEDAPITSVISFHSELSHTNGLGGFIINDMTGPTSRFIVNASYAYIIDMDKMFLSFGLSGELMQYRMRGNSLTYSDLADPVMDFNSERNWRPEANFGMLLYNDRFYAGFAVNQILKSQFRPYSVNDVGEIEMARHIFLMGQYDFLVDNHRISPSVFMGYAKSSPVSADISVAWLYNNSIGASLGYRLKDAISVSAGYRFNKFYLAYSYDIVTTQLRSVNSGSHEIMLSFDISPQQRVNTPMFSSGNAPKSSNRKSNKRAF